MGKLDIEDQEQQEVESEADSENTSILDLYAQSNNEEKSSVQ